MYLSFYGFSEKPFNATPDPKFLYLAPGHRDALAQLTYGVQESRGFVVLTGEVGTGKTTLVQALRRRLDGTTNVSFVFNSTLPFDELLEYILEDFGVTSAGSRAQRLVAFNNLLVERRRRGEKTVLIIDEAQNLSPSTLEEVRLLSNFETPTEKLLQIVLAGQPELRDKLRLPELRQLKQRVGLRCHINPLAGDEIRDYIRNRLRVAGARDASLFSEASVRLIAEYSAGIPRLVNIVCDHCLLIGYAAQRRRIEPKIVQEAIVYLEEGERPSARRAARTTSRWSARGWQSPVRWGVVAAVTVLAVGLAALAVQAEPAYLYHLALATKNLLLR